MGSKIVTTFPVDGRSSKGRHNRARSDVGHNRRREGGKLFVGCGGARQQHETMRKKVDARIRSLVERCVNTGERSMFVVIGDRGRDQVVNLHYMLSKAVVKARPSVLWCYKKDLYLSSHRRKRMKQIKKMAQRGLLDPEKEDPFALFVASTNIRYCYYHETHKILGNTFGMCVIQDFEALTPNLLARTIETVEGGGAIVLLLSTMDSLSQLYTMTMDVHARFRTESHKEVVPRFNERFILSLASCRNCLLIDDELNVLPHSAHVKDISSLNEKDGKDDTPEEVELKYLKDSLQETLPAGPLVNCCKTLDQAKSVVTFLDAASEKTLRSTVALTAARGRGKSAALGVAIAGALGMGYANIFVTAPSPENLRTLFEFVFKGLDALGYKEHIDYDLVESMNPELGNAIIRVNVFRDHRQTVQYIQPHHHERMSQAELLVIDEAAAIPLPIVRKMLGPYLVFLCSTVNGYEGTGRSLSLKLIQQLREQGSKVRDSDSFGPASASSGAAIRQFREVELSEPIRYAKGDDVEKWLNGLLCLNATDMLPAVPKRLPHPQECNLYYVNRDTLFSYHKASEAFLQRMMALYVSSHYRNTPNDLQMMSDAPAHHLFVLLGPVDESTNSLPDIFCVVQVALEGSISRKSAFASLSQGMQPQGDLIPWTVSQQFQDTDFPSLSGARIVRIATHPGAQRGGYGTRAVSLLSDYYSGLILPTDLVETDKAVNGRGSPAPTSNRLLNEQLKPRTNLPPLLLGLSERKNERLHYLGTSYGLTQELYNFWSRLKFKPVYIRQTPSEVTGENTCVMVSPLISDQMESMDWIQPFVQDFQTRFVSLLSMAFRDFPPALALSIIDPKMNFSHEELDQLVSGDKELLVWKANGQSFSADDLKRLQQYSNNLVDHHLILDLIPAISRGFFSGSLPTNLSYGQAAILLCLGLQNRGLNEVQECLNLPSNQILALFNKAIRKLYGVVKAVTEAKYGKSLPVMKDRPKLMPLQETLEDVLKDAGDAGNKHLNELTAKLLDVEKLQHFAIKAEEEVWNQNLKGKVPNSGLVSLKSSKSVEDQQKFKKVRHEKARSSMKSSKRRKK